jgi:hypothetical protein
VRSGGYEAGLALTTHTEKFQRFEPPFPTHRKIPQIRTLSNDFPKNPKLSKKEPKRKNPQKKIPKFEPF